MKLFVTSDLHGKIEGLDPQGADLVLMAGDIAPIHSLDAFGICRQAEWVSDCFCAWCRKYPDVQFRFIPGNHDWFATDRNLLSEIRWPDNARMLVDEADEVCGLKLYGTPWVPYINGCWAFETTDDSQLDEHFSLIPDGLDILLTHAPPRLPRQKIDVSLQWNSPHFGSPALTKSIKRAKPCYVFCGHIHTGDHRPIPLRHSNGRLTMVRNVSRIDENYEIAFPPVELSVWKSRF